MRTHVFHRYLERGAAEDRAWEETRELGTGSPRTWGLTSDESLLSRPPHCSGHQPLPGFVLLFEVLGVGLLQSFPERTAP